MEKLKDLVNTVCDDDNLSYTEKLEILYEWKAKLIDTNSRIMTAEQAKKHLLFFGIIEDAIKLCS